MTLAEGQLVAEDGPEGPEGSKGGDFGTSNFEFAGKVGSIGPTLFSKSPPKNLDWLG